MNDVVAGFRNRWGFLQCAGAVDGTHITIIAPNEYHADNHNRKWCYSILMQAVVDHDYRFTDVYIGWPGQVHDARVFDNSRIFRKTEDRTLFPNDIVNIEGVQMPIVVLGAPAYLLVANEAIIINEDGTLCFTGLSDASTQTKQENKRLLGG